MAKYASLDEPAEISPPHPVRRSFFVRFKEGVLLPYVDRLEWHFEHTKDAGWEEFKSRIPGASFQRAFPSLHLSQLQQFIHPPRLTDDQPRLPSLVQYHLLEVPGASSPAAVLEALRAWPAVEAAEESIAVRAPGGPLPVDPSDDSMFCTQSYLRPAPVGVNAYWAWHLPGGTGAGGTVLDLEAGWAHEHVDLLDPAGSPRARLLYGANLPGQAAHGAAVLGILCATDNGTHMVGIAPHTPRIGLVSHSGFTRNIPDAIVQSLLQLTPDGDLTHLPPGIVLVIEVELLDGLNRRWPVEYIEAIRIVLYYASFWGVTTVLAAGNGARDLDAYTDPQGRQVFLPGGAGFVDTGSLYVGAGSFAPQIDPANPWTRHPYSNYGQRVTAFAQGDDVATLWVNGQNPETGQTQIFGMTSAATAIVGGAALCCQGLAQQSAARRRFLDPREIRSLLTTREASRLGGVRAHTATADPARGGLGGIGVMPSLRFIGRQHLGLADPVLKPITDYCPIPGP